MEKKEDILIEMEQISKMLAGIGNKNVYEAPANYFIGLSETVIEKVKTIVNLPEVSIPYSLPPEGYFQDLASNILFKIKSGTSIRNEVEVELEEIAPLLNTISNHNVYSVPDDYFDKFGVSIPAETKRQTAKVVSIQSRTRAWLKYVAVAVAAGLIGTATYLFVGDKNPATQFADKVNIHQKISALSDKEISDFLNEQAYETDISPINYKMYNSSTDIESSLKNISTEEIKSYLNNTEESNGKTARGI